MGIDSRAMFLETENVDGISLVQNLEFVRDVQIRLGSFNQGSCNRFPVNDPIYLNKTNMKKLKTAGPVAVAPKPLGVRYLLYVDPEGRMFLENKTQHIFIVDQHRAPQQIPRDSVFDGIIVKKITRGGAADEVASNNTAGDGKLTFVVMDATRINGMDLTRKSILERISTARVCKL